MYNEITKQFDHVDLDTFTAEQFRPYLPQDPAQQWFFTALLAAGWSPLEAYAKVMKAVVDR